MPDYARYFDSPPGSAACDIVELGQVYLPSGKIYCCDPFLSHEVNAFDRGVQPGHYPVKLCVATLPDWGKRVALAALMFASAPPSKWLKAVYRIDQTPLSGFRVDAGLACFMDWQTAELFSRFIDEYYEKNPERNYYDDVLAAEFKRNADPTDSRSIGDWDLHYPIAGDPRNIAIFASGLGDSVYSAYWGLDGEDRPVMLVADFELL